MIEYKDSIFPFLWIRNESKKQLEKEIDAIKNLSINSFVVESRPYTSKDSDFATESWFNRFETILKYAKEKGMHVWLLDDKSFPTGIANGAINTKYPKLKARQIKCNATDVALNDNPKAILTGIKGNDKLLLAFIKNSKHSEEISINENNQIIELPKLKGQYRVYFLIETEDSPERDGYIDMLNKKSVDVLIKEVYEPHYQRFKDYFGSTFIGFFSDEPRFANGINWFYGTPVSMYDYSLGKLNVAYPFSQEVLNELLNKGYEKKDLLSLFVDFNDRTSDLRIDYMDIITKKYSENLVSNLSKWCEEHDVLYTGHIIEDDGCHLTTGCGAGHYFRAMKDANYASIDVVLHQIKPFYSNKNSISPIEGGYSNHEFNYYTLGKLASSCAVQSRTANGKSLCEIFGAYGWSESISDMLYLVNHMAVSGINTFIPHAFSMNLYDKDCPPYFYGEGKNPSFEGYKKLFEYMNFLSQFSHRSFAHIAVLYNADSIWSNKSNYSMNKVAKTLMQNQVEFDFIDVDNIRLAKISNNKLTIESCSYDTLIVPSGYLSKETQELIDSLPIEIIFAHNNSFIKEIKSDYILSKKHKDLRIRRVSNETYMLFNEGLNVINNSIELSEKELCLVDYHRKEIVSESTNGVINFVLKPAESLLLCTNKPTGYSIKTKLKKVNEIKTALISTKYFDDEKYTCIGINGIDYSIFKHDPNFSGTIKFEFNVTVGKHSYLKVEYYGEQLISMINGNKNVSIVSPAIIKLKEGTNNIELYVSNTLANSMKDNLSMYSTIEECGISKISVIEKR